MDIPTNISPSLSDGDAGLEADREYLRLWVQSYKPFLAIFLDAFVIVDVTNKVIDFNVAFNELTGESYRKTLKIGDFCTLLKTELCPDKCPAKQTIAARRAVRLDEIKGGSKAYPNLHMILGGIPIVSADGARVVGALLTIRNVTAETELQKKYYERKEESATDGLTKLYNKVYTEAMMLKLVKTAMREPKVRISVLMSDIDHFKKVNDTYGHQAGDHVLSVVAGILKQEARESDVVGRFGGEEFTAVLYSTDQVGTRIFAERFRRKVEATRIEHQGKIIPVTISVGTATFSMEWSPGVDAESLVKNLVAHADAALYFAKANGRNQTCQYENLPAGQKKAAK